MSMHPDIPDAVVKLLILYKKYHRLKFCQDFLTKLSTGEILVFRIKKPKNLAKLENILLFLFF